MVPMIAMGIGATAAPAQYTEPELQCRIHTFQYCHHHYADGGYSSEDQCLAELLPACDMPSGI